MSSKEFVDETYMKFGDAIKKRAQEEGNIQAAYDFGITVKDVKQICRMLGGCSHELGNIPREVIDEWKREFELCKSVRSIGNAWGCSPQAVRDALEGCGVHTYGNHGNTGNSMDVARKLALKGRPFKEITEQTGITEAGIWFAVNMEGKKNDRS